MKKTDYNRVMKEEIRKRLESGAWNFQMAARVMEKKGSPAKRIFTLFLPGSAAVAAMFLVALWIVKEPAGKGGYEQFVSIQVKGTYDEVFDTGLKNTASAGAGRTFISSQVSGTYRDVFQKDRNAARGRGDESDPVSSTDVDSFIDDVLAMR